MWRIELRSGPCVGRHFELDLGEHLLGRDQNCRIFISGDPTLSRLHAKLTIGQNGISIQDLGSSGGTFVNGSRLQPNSPLHLQVNDTVSVGQSEFSTVKMSQSPQVHVPPPPRQADRCGNCAGTYGFMGQSAQSREIPGVCNQCAKLILNQCEVFRRCLQADLNVWQGTPEQLRSHLVNRANFARVELGLAVSKSLDVAQAFLQRLMSFLLQDGVLDQSEEDLFYRFVDAFQLNRPQIAGLESQVKHYSFVREIRSGRLPSIKTSAMLPSGEIPHMETSALFFRELTSGTRTHQGLLLLTNSRLLFTQSDYPFEAPISKIVGINYFPPNKLQLNLSRRLGSGLYQSDQAFYFVELARAVLELHHRHKVLQTSGTRSIPQPVKSAVWSRDGGRCVQCGGTEYLEFDHIIPFSKGGATSEGNLQLLCRRCNLVKRDNL